MKDEKNKKTKIMVKGEFFYEKKFNKILKFRERRKNKNI